MSSLADLLRGHAEDFIITGGDRGYPLLLGFLGDGGGHFLISGIILHIILVFLVAWEDVYFFSLQVEYHISHVFSWRYLVFLGGGVRVQSIYMKVAVL